jgi:F-type H+-transporting ATPase subunit gamma
MHGNLKEIRERLKGTRKVLQVTQALEHISSVRMAKSRALLGAHELYARRLELVIQALRQAPGRPHPFLTPHPEGRLTLLVFGSDRGLCGGYNSALIEQVELFVKRQGGDVALIVIGQLLANRLRNVEHTLDYSFPQPPLPGYSRPLAEIVKNISAGFRGGRYREVHALHTPFTPGKPLTPKIVPLLPIPLASAAGGIPFSLPSGDRDLSRESEFLRQALSEPEPETLIRQLAPQHLRTLVAHLFLNSITSEHTARHIAMIRARDNAKDMVDELTVAGNRLRQEQITTEVAELSSGANNSWQTEE